MTIPELLTTLRQLDVHVWAEGERVRCSAPQGAMTPRLQEELTRNRAEILRYLRSASNDGELARPPLAPVPHGTSPPLSFFQERLWILDRLEPGNPAYTLVASLRDTGPIDFGALRASLTEMVRRHEVLRCAFREVAGSPTLVIAPAKAVLPALVDLRQQVSASQDAEVDRIMATEAQRPFRLDIGGLLRVTFVVLSDNGYTLVVAMHHIVTDQWSMSLFLHEWQVLYRAYAAGAPSPLPDVAVQYPAYAYWERQWLGEAVLGREAGFWKAHLEGVPHMLALPTDRPRPPLQSYSGGVQGFEIPADLADRLRAVCRDEGITLYMAMLATFNLLLRRYSGQTDMLVGTPVATRNRPELEGIVGPLVNSLVLRTWFLPDDTSRSLRARVRQTVLEARVHQDYPFAQLVQLMAPDRSMAYAPLFQVGFTFQNAPGRSAFTMVTGGAMYDLTLHSWEVGTSIGASFEYATALFDATTIARMAQHFVVLLREMTIEPNRPVTELPMLTAVERGELLGKWNQTERDYARETVLSQIFEAQAARTPDRVAVASEESSRTYLDLNRRANQVARHLRRRGVGPGVRVAVCLNRSPRLLEALLGVIKSGGTYVPLDPEFPQRRIAFMLRDSGAALVLSEAAVEERLGLGDPPVLCLDQECAALDAEDSQDLDVSVGPEDPVYVMYTSGSTGEPKGVEVPHGALVNLLSSMQHEPGLSERDVLYAITTVAFDISGLELFLPLVVGAKVVVASTDTARDGRRLQQDLARWGATVMQATPATWQMLVDTGWPAGSGRTSLCAWSGGDTLSRELADALLLRTRAVWNLYGPTETTIWSAVSRVASDSGLVPIGRPIANTQMYVLDSNQQPVPVGVVGEVYIGGRGVARGYLNRAALTDERFVPDPFSGVPGSRLYRSGDLGRYRPGGELEHLGRIDDQVKLRGFRIELGEIEAVLATHPAVLAAVAAVRNSRLVAYAVTDPGSVLTATDSRRFLQERLPDYMVPMLVVTLDQFPLTANGKIDRRALPDPFAGAGGGNDVVPPETTTERRIAELWQRLLGVPRVSVHQNFFDLGGHSLLAVKAAYEIERLFGRPVDVRALFFETLRQLAARCDAMRPVNPAPVQC